MKRVLITGGSRGLGLTIVQNLLNNGYNVVSLSRSISPELEQLKNKFNHELKTLVYDLTDVENLEVFLKENIPYTDSYCGLINNAAMAYDDLSTNLNLERVSTIFNANVFSTFVLTKHLIKNFLFNKSAGSIVNISSISAHTGYKGLSFYAATKGAIEAYSKNIAREWGAKQIRSNCLVVGFMNTDMSASLSDDEKERIFKRTSLKNPTKQESVSATVEFLLSEKSSSITGTNMFVDSGTI